MDDKLRRTVMREAGCACEAMVQNERGMWTRCWNSPVDVHHLLTKARGGAILDDVGEMHHLMCVCRYHHMMCEGTDAYMNGLLIDGYVKTENGKPVYYGTDAVLKGKYGNES